MKDNLGYVHVYCGDGKGKTTTAMGLCTRAAGYGYKVLIYQFMKITKPVNGRFCNRFRISLLSMGWNRKIQFPDDNFRKTGTENLL